MKERLSAVISRYGDAFTVGADSGQAIFVPLTLDRAQAYLSETELSAAGRPMWAGYLPFDDTTATSATVDWNGLSLTVLRVLDLRLRNATVARLMILVA